MPPLVFFLTFSISATYEDTTIDDALYLIPHKKIAMCVPSKNGCALVSAATSFLNNKSISWESSWAKSFGYDKERVINEIYNDPKWTKVFVYRDPEERFLSVFKSKCMQEDMGYANECARIFGQRVSSIENATSIMKKRSLQENSDRHISIQKDFCYNFYKHKEKFQFIVRFDRNKIVKYFKTFLEQYFDENQIYSAFKAAMKFAGEDHKTSTKFQNLKLKNDESDFLKKFYAADYETFNIRPNPNIELLIPAMGQFDIIKRHINSFWDNYYGQVRIADDGENDLTKKYTQFCFLKPCSYTYYGLNKGSSFKRNRLAEKSKTKLVFFADADIVWTPKSDIFYAKNVLLDGAEIVAMTYANPEKQWSKRPWIGQLQGTKNKIIMYYNATNPFPKHEKTCVETDISDNQFLTKKATVLKNLWREELKTQEHAAFFFDFKTKGAGKVVQCLNLQVNHLTSRNEDYMKIYNSNNKKSRSISKTQIVYDKTIPKILVFMLASYNTKDRFKAAMETWGKKIKLPHKLFVIGDSKLCSEFNTYQIPCFFSHYKSYNDIVQRLSHFYLSLDASMDFTHVFKCDDDTFVNFKNLENFALAHADKNSIYGFPIGGPGTKNVIYPQGGAGYLMSRTIFNEIIDVYYFISMNQQKFALDKSNPEDFALGIAAKWKKIEIKNFENGFLALNPKQAKSQLETVNIKKKISVHPVKNATTLFQMGKYLR